MSYVCLRPRTEEARAILGTYGDIWTVGGSYTDPIYGSQRKLEVRSTSDMRSKSMWIDERHDELFEVIWT